MNQPDDDNIKQPPVLVLYLREWREWAGLTQEQLAEAIGESSATYGRYERGERTRVTLDFLTRFARAVGCPNEFDPIAGPPGLLPIAYRMIRDIDPAHRERALELLKIIMATMLKDPATLG
jgi:transcriptional regulator with XRE-family HTH domain